MDLALETIPRVLGATDRDSSAESYGSCDRQYWHYRLHDMSNARLQEAGLLFALAYGTETQDNPFFRSEKLLMWIQGIWKFWLADRNSDGSCSEVYPNERSFCATAFSAAGFCETIRLTGGYAGWQRELIEAKKTIAWLAMNTNPEVANQMAASALALQAWGQLTGDEEFSDVSHRRLSDCIALQKSSGVFPEYGGFDTGYQTITMSVLTNLLKWLPKNSLESEYVSSALKKAEQAVDRVVDGNGRIDSSARSRNTDYLYPHAFAALKSSVLQRIGAGLSGRFVLRPTWMDDRYCIALAADYLYAYREIMHVDDNIPTHSTAPV
ncbi:hypothetical protein ACQ0MK_10605 [Thalassospira lucentensis]|uniref:hypothetical protein n=1 Tax=Thalassospira lucentensis TaxID=168935 RepID=UPI003D2F1CC0